MDTHQLTSAIHATTASVDPTVPIVAIKTQTALIDHLLVFDRLLSTLSGAFGAIALLLSVLGLVGLLAYTVARRTNEIGIRMAVGASEADVVRLVLKDSLLLVGSGIVLGLPAAFLMGRLLKHVLFNLSTADPLTAVASLAVLATVAILATWGPARRAARIDPMTALREE